MGKRSSFERKPRDMYPTPRSAVLPLLPHLTDGTRFCEPCAGAGDLINALEEHGHFCDAAWDIEPLRSDIDRYDALSGTVRDVDCFITNPPWDRKILHPLITHLSDQHPTWLLFDADWVHTRQSAPFMNRLLKIVSVGRVKWEPGSPFVGKDNCAWHLFEQPSDRISPIFFGRSIEKSAA